MQHLIVFLVRARASNKVPQILWGAGAPPLGIGAWLTHRNTLLSHVCYHTKFRRSRSNRLGVGNGVHKIWRIWPRPPWDMGRGSPLRNTLLYNSCYHAKFVGTCEASRFDSNSNRMSRFEFDSKVTCRFENFEYMPCAVIPQTTLTHC